MRVELNIFAWWFSIGSACCGSHMSYFGVIPSLFRMSPYCFLYLTFFVRHISIPFNAPYHRTQVLPFLFDPAPAVAHRQPFIFFFIHRTPLSHIQRRMVCRQQDQLRLFARFSPRSFISLRSLDCHSNSDSHINPSAQPWRKLGNCGPHSLSFVRV